MSMSSLIKLWIEEQRSSLVISNISRISIKYQKSISSLRNCSPTNVITESALDLLELEHLGLL